MARTKRKTSAAVTAAQQYELDEAIFPRIVEELEKHSGFSRQHIANEAGVCIATLYHWTNGHVRKPLLTTIMRVGHALGFRFSMTKTATRKLRRVK